MTTKTRPVDVQIGSKGHRSLLVEPENGVKGRTVVVLPDWYGRTAVQEAFGHRLANQGHSALCLDIYGDGRIAEDNGEAESLMSPLVADRTSLVQMLSELLDSSRAEAGLERLSLIGFCFGGLCALDLARTGREFDLCASFHGLLDPHPMLTGMPIQARVAVFHGWRDPFAAPSSLMRLAEELDQAGADWQFHCFGQAMHAFMMEQADAPDSGLAYNGAAADGSWGILTSLLESRR